MPEYIGPDGREHWYITSYEGGPWQVCSGRSGCGYDNRTWYILNIKTGRTKRIGPIRLKGKNYFDAACEEALRRNAMEEGQKWYFTFCQNQPLLKNRYVSFRGTYGEAREKMVENFGTHWAFQYSEAEFAGQPEKYKLKMIDL